MLINIFSRCTGLMIDLAATSGILQSYYNRRLCKDTNRLQIPIQAEDVWDDTDENSTIKLEVKES